MYPIPIKDIVQWDISSWSVAIKYWEKEVDWSKINNALELGAREGGISLWIANKGIQITCSDIQNIEITAKQLHSRYSLSDLIKYENIDANKISYENFFDLVIFKSIVGGIGKNPIEQQNVFNQIHKALKPGGILLFAENLEATPIHKYLRKKYIWWGTSWRYISIKELKSYLSNFSKIDLNTTGVIATFGRTENQRNLLFFIDKYLLNII